MRAESGPPVSNQTQGTPLESGTVAPLYRVTNPQFATAHFEWEGGGEV